MKLFFRTIILHRCFRALGTYLIAALLLEALPGAFIFADEAAGTVVDTGDAVAAIEIQNNVNVNETNVTPAASEDAVEAGSAADLTMASEHERVSDLDATSTLTSAESTETDHGTTTIVVLTENDAVLVNDAAGVATTGDNNVTVQSGSASIATGNAVATANVINVANVNIVDSDGLLLLLNAIYGNQGTVDVRAVEGMFDPGTSSCMAPCGNESIIRSIESTSTADVLNSIVLRSMTGANAINGGDVVDILTGNAYAAANILNIANTNIVDSQYLMMVLNNFGDWAGDLVLPGKEFFSSFFRNGAHSGSTAAVSGGFASFSASNSNDGVVENKILGGASSGDNATLDTGTSVTTTGNANASVNLINEVNKNLVGGSSLVILFRIHGNWSGKVFSPPPGVVWRETSFGIEVMGSDVPASDDSSNGVAIEADDSGGGQINAIKSANSARIQNNVELYALSGANNVNNALRSSTATGDAYATANVMNLANTNVYGRNWIWAIVNIFGDWSGNLAFGRPDLWVGSRAEAGANSVAPGKEVKYHYTIYNRGDADATNVRLTSRFDASQIMFENSDLTAWANGGTVTWDIGTIAAGKSVNVSYTGIVQHSIEQGVSKIGNTVSIVSNETDGNPKDNTDVVVIYGEKAPRDTSGGVELNMTPDPKLTIAKTNNATSSLSTSTTVEYRVVVKNEGLGSAYHGTLVDELRDEAGKLIKRQEWPLGEIFAGEEISVGYAMTFSKELANGVYVNSAQVKAIGRHPSTNPFYGAFADSPVATSSVVIERPLVAASIETSTSISFALMETASTDALRVPLLREAAVNTVLEIAGIARANAAVIDSPNEPAVAVTHEIRRLPQVTHGPAPELPRRSLLASASSGYSADNVLLAVGLFAILGGLWLLVMRRMA